MNLKKTAVRGIVVLAIFVALCMFFSGTIRTITTPKVKLVSGRRGKLEERTELTAKLAFPEVDRVAVELPADTTVTITKVNTRVGYAVVEGDVLIEAKVTNYDQARKQYQEAYDQATEQLLALENKNRGIRVTRRDEQYAEAYFSLRDARREAVALEMDMDALLAQEGLKRADSGYPEGASDALKAAVDAWRAAAARLETARQAMDDAARYTVDEAVWSYITESRTCQEKIDEAEAGLRALLSLSERVRALAAPHDGYVAELNVKEGDTYDGAQPLYAITAREALPVLQADVSELKRAVAEGTVVSLNIDSYDAVETTVIGSGIDAEGKKYVNIQLTDALISARGSVYAMTLEDTTLTLIDRAREATTLLPVSAVRGSGEERYVYTVEQESAPFGGTVMKLRKMAVKVLAESGGTASLEEDVSYYTIAYMEDRPVNEGDAVMEYLS